METLRRAINGVWGALTPKRALSDKAGGPEPLQKRRETGLPAAAALHYEAAVLGDPGRRVQARGKA